MGALTEDHKLKLAELLRMRMTETRPDYVLAITPNYGLWIYSGGVRRPVVLPYPEVIDREWQRKFPDTAILGY